MKHLRRTIALSALTLLPLLRLPDDVDTFAMMPIGWPVDNFGALTRRPLAEVVHADSWGMAWPG
jgi:hypothetical protein